LAKYPINKTTKHFGKGFTYLSDQRTFANKPESFGVSFVTTKKSTAPSPSKSPGTMETMRPDLMVHS
jgi:hypothetical protein